MHNLEGIRDPRELRVFEYGATSLRLRQLSQDPSLVEHTYDAGHVRAIHAYLFQDVYEWAGQYRSVNMGKGMSRFADVHSGQVDRYLRDVHRIVTGTPWDRLDRDEFGSATAAVFAFLNQAHPFREGNGRTSKVFMEHVAEQSRFTLDFARVTPEVWNNASMLSGPDLGAYEPVPDSLVPVFRHIAVERVTTSPDADSTTRSRSTPDVSRRNPSMHAARRRSGLQQPYHRRMGHGNGSAGLGR